jgi:hypothetical protein
LQTKADILMMLDDDLSFPAEAMKSVIESPDEICCGVYRMKTDNITFPATLFHTPEGDLVMRDDGCVRGWRCPTGFMKIHRSALEKMVAAYPERVFKDTSYVRATGEWGGDSYDIFPVGVHNMAYEGEDTGFCRLWEQIGGEIWIQPNITFNHYAETGKYYRGNYWDWIKQKLLTPVVEPLKELMDQVA